jgi:cytochrome c oxidase subunit IV
MHEIAQISLKRHFYVKHFVQLLLTQLKTTYYLCTYFGLQTQTSLTLLIQSLLSSQGRIKDSIFSYNVDINLANKQHKNN